MAAVSAGSRFHSPRFNQSACAAEPQKPSTPCVPDTITNTFGASFAPIQATSVARGSPWGPDAGYGWDSSDAAASFAEATNNSRALEKSLEKGECVMRPSCELPAKHRRNGGAIEGQSLDRAAGLQPVIDVSPGTQHLPPAERAAD